MSYLEEFKDDVFISYAHRDNKPLTEDQKGWVTRFHETLETVLGQRLGADPAFFRDPKLAGNDYFDDKLMQEIAATAVFVSVMSPSYLHSDYCRKELDEFCKIAQQQGALRVASRSRIFKVLPTFVSREEIRGLPGDVEKLLGFEFFEIDPATKRPLEYTTETDPELCRKYLARIGDVAFFICDLLKTLKAGVAPCAKEATISVYLAETTYDQRDARDQIKRELLERGYDVLPEGDLPDYGPDFLQAVQAALKKSSLSIHLIGEYSARIPERETQSVVFLQNELAEERAKDGSFARLIWMPVGLCAKDEPQRKFIEELQNDPAKQADCELLQTSLEELKTVIEDRLQKLRKPAAAPTSTSTGPARIYIICDAQDLEAAVEVADYFHGQGFVPVLPLVEGEEADVRRDYKENLVLSDAALIWYGSTNEGWVRAKLLDLQKACGFGRSKPFLAKAIYVAGPETAQKKTFRNYEAAVLANFGTFSPAAIQSFVAQIKAGA
jgi:TIR domain